MNNTAHWIYTGGTQFFFHIYTCSNCGKEEVGSRYDEPPEPPEAPFCRWCGYKMEGEVEND